MPKKAIAEFHWERMSGPEVAALARRTNVALVPVGCMEMHGPHLPTGTDAFHALAVCEHAARIEPAVVLPPIFYNLNDQMMGYPGTMHIRIPTLVRLYHDICMECARNGFDRILFMVGHGGSQTPIDELQSRALERRMRTGRWDYFPTQTYISALIWEEIQKFFPGVAEHHGGPAEASWVLACRPELVHLERVRSAGLLRRGKLMFARPRVPWVRQVPKGYGDRPWLADAEKGRKMLEAAGRRLAQIIRRLKKFNPDRDH